MPSKKQDPLLTVAKVALVVFEIVMVLTLVLLAIGATAVLTFQRSEVLAGLASNGAPAGTYVAVLAVLALLAGLVLLALCFAIQLKRIVDTVKEGDPFQPANASRLARMAWYALGSQLCTWLVEALVAYYGPYAESIGGENVTVSAEASGTSLTGMFLALVLFILARVFRKGADMRDELEGTV